MRRPPSGTNDSGSLELLLDTICNTFGGILFISILVVVLLNMTSKEATTTPPRKTAQSTMLALQQQLQQANLKLQRLQVAVQQQQRIRSNFVTEDSIQLAHQLRQKRVELSSAQTKKNGLFDDITLSQSEINQLAAVFKTQDESLEQTKEELAKVTPQLEKEVKQRSRSSKLPTLTTWTKETVGFLLRGNKLWALLTPDGAPDLNEVKLVAESGSSYLDPISTAGTVVDVTGHDTSDIVRKLLKYDPTQQMIKVFVSPRSHSEFAIVQREMVKRRFKYAIIPFPDSERIGWGTSSGALPKAQ